MVIPVYFKVKKAKFFRSSIPVYTDQVLKAKECLNENLIHLNIYRQFEMKWTIYFNL